MQGSIFSQNPVLEKILRSNENSANRLVSWIILGHSFIIAGVLLAYNLGGIELGYPYTIVLTYLAFIIEFSVALIGLNYKENHSWLKWLLIPSFIISTGFLYFCFNSTSLVFLFIPVVLSSRYYNTRFSFSISIINYLCFIAVCVLNMTLDKVSSQVFLQHRIDHVALWANWQDVLKYTISIRSGEFLLLTLLIINIVKNGYHVGQTQAALKKDIDNMKTEFSIGAEIQQNILPMPDVSTCNGKWQVGATMLPAKEVAGDFYDYFLVGDNHFVILIADVSDKGLPAAMFMMSAKNEIRSAIISSKNLQEAAILANHRLLRNNKIGMFVSAWIGCFNIHTGEGTFINAGHTNPIVRHKDGTTEFITNDPDTFFGVFDHYAPEMHNMKLSAGDTLLLYTDGVTDCVNVHKEMFGTGRLNSLVKSQNCAAQPFCESVVEGCKTFANGAPQFDDVTLLALQMTSEERVSGDLCYEANQDSVEQIITSINEILTKYDCPENTRRLIDTVLDEICVNIVDYAYDEKGGNIEIGYEIYDDRIYLRIADTGNPFNPLNVDAPDLTTISEHGGLGIHITKKIMDNLNYMYRNGRNCLEMVKYWSKN